LLRLYLSWGKPRLVTSRSRSVSSSSQKPLLWPVCQLRLACSRSFLSSPPGSVHLHRTATILSLAGTLLLMTGWHPTANPWLAPYCHSSLAGIPSARQFCSPTFLSPSCHLLYGRKPSLGYDGSWYCTTSLAHSKRQRAATFRSLPTFEPPPQPDFTVRVLGLGILAIVVVSWRFFVSFLSVTRGPAEGFRSLSCTFV